jgi:hypothetical protein
MRNAYDKLSVDYDKLLAKILSFLMEVELIVNTFELLFCEPQANGLSSILWLVINSPLLKTTSPLIFHFEWLLYICSNYQELEGCSSSQ